MAYIFSYLGVVRLSVIDTCCLLFCWYLCFLCVFVCCVCVCVCPSVKRVKTIILITTISISEKKHYILRSMLSGKPVDNFVFPLTIAVSPCNAAELEKIYWFDIFVPSLVFTASFNDIMSRHIPLADFWLRPLVPLTVMALTNIHHISMRSWIPWRQIRFFGLFDAFISMDIWWYKSYSSSFPWLFKICTNSAPSDKNRTRDIYF